MSFFPSKSSNIDPTSILRRMNELRTELAGRNPEELAKNTGSIFTCKNNSTTDRLTGTFNITVWGKNIMITYPEWVAFDSTKQTPVSPVTQALLLYYYITADGTALAGKLVSFSQLPNGMFYNQAFQGYTGGELARFFGNRQEQFKQSAVNAGGRPDCYAPGDLAFAFQALPRIPLYLAYWQGDEDFPSSYQVLFDASIPHYLPTDVCAILGSMLVGTIKKAST